MLFIDPREEVGILWLKGHNQSFIVTTMSLEGSC